MDLAKQSLQALKKISQEHPTTCLRVGACWLFFLTWTFSGQEFRTMRTISLVKAANDLPVTGEIYSGKKQPGLHGMVAYYGVDGAVIHFQASASGRAQRDVATWVTQGWHSQRLLGNGEVNDPIIKDRNFVSVKKRERQLKSTSLLKKVDEITTLCDIQACAIIYTPDEPEPEVWPSDQGVESVIFKFREVSELARNKIMLCQESLLRKNIIQAQGQLKKLRNENRKKEIDLFLCQYFAGGNNLEESNIIDLNDITFLVDKKLEEITKKIEMLHVQEEP